ncbi:hypothetical protein [Microbacterium lushaniae]|uniref:Uncharacterized protein n=1 Tax=Microbacterium lushaniae TaxID=2614639 RepID=A0A5J6L0L5_9MICO|nr:hypothetical protein [Microbacterium lushaniae]QEW02015.1 hypothetical protein F6J85_02140 [Microbacterium lushaniae]
MDRVPHHLLAEDEAAVAAIVAEADRRGWDAVTEPLGEIASPGAPAFPPAVRVRLTARPGAAPPDARVLARALRTVPGVLLDETRRLH